MHAQPDAVDELVDAIISLGGPLTSIVNHMASFRASRPGGPPPRPIPLILRELLCGTLVGLRDDEAAADLETAARILDRVTDIVCAEILLVDPDALD